MTIKNSILRKVQPTHPGEMLREDFMPDFRLTPTTLAKALCVSRQTVNELLHERRAISHAMALRLAKLFGNTHDFWLNAQRAVDLWKTREIYGNEILNIRPLKAVGFHKSAPHPGSFN